MKSGLKLNEDGFSLEFIAGSGDTFQNNSSLRKSILSDEDSYVLQEIIIAPPHMINQVNNYSSITVAPQKSNPPLIFTGPQDMPVQYSSIVVKTEKGKSVVQKSDWALKMMTEGINILYSAPILSSQIKQDGLYINGFGQIRNVLESFQMKESAIARTWLFMRDILKDYEELNMAREQFFAKIHSSVNQIFPASTGIQGHVIGNETLAFEFCAFSGEKVAIEQVSSPLQNEPAAYGKLFSRAVVVRFPRSELLFISGTASIDKNGLSVYVGNFKSQMEFTMEILSAILKQENCGFSNVAQAIVYLKRTKDMGDCFQMLDKVGFPRERALFQTGVDICRDDLLCEIELTAVATQK
jgi:enamine deaminase RidA (YjgF/YER057c/UK114 family)